MTLYDLIKRHGDSTDFLFRIFINGTKHELRIDDLPFKFLNKRVSMWELAFEAPLYDTEVLIFKVWLKGDNE